MTLEQELENALEHYNAQFKYNEDNKTWCLFGTDRGNGWETDDYDADTIAQAKADALEYLETYNETI
jgi:hypothetical protein